MLQSFYEDTSVPLLTSPEADKWPGEVLPPDFMNYNQDFSVPELFLLEDIDSLPEKFDDVGSEEDLLSILDEIITEDEKKTEGKFLTNVAIRTREIDYIIAFFSHDLQLLPLQLSLLLSPEISFPVSCNTL